MITLFTSTRCPSCRKAMKWLKENNFTYEKRDIFKDPPSKDEIKKILQMTENGVGEIIVTRSKIFQELNVEIESLSLGELYKLIERYPGVLRKPILMDNKRLQVGFKEIGIRCFLPRSVRTFELKKLLEEENVIHHL